MTKYEKRCADCAECKKVKGVLVCSDAWDKPINEIDECTLGIELEEIENLETKAKVYKGENAKSESHKERKPREKKIDAEKVSIIAEIFGYLAENGYENVKITNESKIIEFDIGENHYKLDLVKARKPKK